MWVLTSIFMACVAGEIHGSNDNIRSTRTSFNPTVTQLESMGLQSDIAKASLYAFEKASLNGLTNNSVFTVIDLRRHSKEKRLWVLDVFTGDLLFHEVTTHGRFSDLDHDGFLESVSNVPQSKKTSVGLYKTAEVYTGKHGRSLRLDGLEKGFNDNARKRNIVIHGADYAEESFVQQHGKAGRSLGCPAVSNDVSDDLITTIKEGSLLLIYANDEKWLNESTYLP